MIFSENRFTLFRIMLQEGMPSKAANQRKSCRKALRHFLDLDLVRIEGEMARNLRHSRERRLVGPDRIFEDLAAGNDAVIVRIALVGTMRHALGPLQQAHVGVLARYILHSGITCFLRSE